MASAKISVFAKGNWLRSLIASTAIICTAGVWADPATSYVSVSSGNATIVDLGDQFAVVFSNVQSQATLTSLRNCYLLRSLVVGGGGGGGKTMGGGGGGGQVVERTGVVALAANDEFAVTVGAGGEWTNPSGYRAGAQGGTSTLVYPDGTTINAYGGGGGGGYSETAPTASANGQIGSGGGNAHGRTTAPTKGTHYNYGNPGGLAQGGGGGASTPGENAGLHVESVLYGNETAYRAQAGYGGEGVTNDISGVNEVYGSGGGGGGGNKYWSQFHAPGGTHAGAGGTRTDKTGGGDGNNNALPADEGFGAGGGAGSFSESGGGSKGGAASKGGCGTVILRFTKVDMSAFMFEIAPIAEEFYYTGSAIEPVPVVIHVKDGSTVDPANYDVAYADNVNPGTATIIVSGKGAYADLYAECSFTILNLMRDEYAVYDDFSVRRTNVNDRIVYVFTNTTDVFTFRARVNLTLVDALVVGGGGSGGHTVGGGGGGGAVVTTTVQRAMFAGREFSLRVGAGGLHATATSGYPSGVQGETSILTFPDSVSIVAYGGGGGGGYTKGPTSSATGEIASGGGAGGGGTFSAGTDSINYSSAYGHIGGTGVYSYGGGGGGAAEGGQAGDSKGGNGGEGVTNSITGIAEVYGSGGGAGARNNGVPGAGGTNAGSGTNGVQTGFAPFIQSGRQGFGGGGGGGGYQSGGRYYGGNGGCGTIVLSFVTGAHVGQPTIASKSISFPGGITQPKVSVTLGNSRPENTFVATVSIVLLDGNGNELGTKTFSGVMAGEPVEWLVPLCVEPSSTVTAQIMVASDGADPVFGTETDTATGEMSPYYGHGGGAGVIHVRPSATGRGDGSDWFNAYTDFRAAILQLNAERPELWFAGNETEVSVKAKISPTVAAVIRGGFSGTEDSAGERVDGAMSICDAVNVGSCFNFDNSQPVTLDGFWLKRGKDHNLVKSGAGDIIVTNCVSSDISSIANGHGGYLVGKSTTVARFVNVRFNNLFGSETVGGNKGTALYLETFSRVFVDDCIFATNGCKFSYGFGNSMYDQDGAALFAKNAPVTVRGTRFLANRSQVLNTNGERGGVVRVTGACGTTAFTNCLFVGNEVVHAYSNTKDYTSGTAGMLAASPSSGSVDIVNCTFAMGLAALTCGPAAVAARAGTVNVMNCIFYGNTNCAWNTAGSDIYVESGATANVSYCLFEDDSPGRIACAEGGTTNLATSTFVYGNPLFVTEATPVAFLKTVSSNMGNTILLDQNKIGDLMAFNAHIRGGYGYIDEKTGALVMDFKSRTEISPAQDTANPAAIFYSGEPNCQYGWHGRRGNLGYYGNTPWATMSARPGFFLLVK